MAARGDWQAGGDVFNFSVGAALLVAGFALGTSSGRTWVGTMLLVAALARAAVAPMEPAETFNRYVWEGRMLELGRSPFAETPTYVMEALPAQALLESMPGLDRTTWQTPLTVWAFRALNAASEGAYFYKFVFVAADLLLCLLLALRFGAERAVLYAWNPLAIYGVAGAAWFGPLFLLPLGAGFLIWERWVERRGGASLINANGGINGGLGQLVCLSAALVGLASALWLWAAPLLLWMVWSILRKAGLKAGAVVFAVGAAPLAISFIWASLAWETPWPDLVRFGMGPRETATAFVPRLLEGALPGAEAARTVSLTLAALFAVYAIARNETMERFGNVFYGGLLLLAPAAHLWSFLWMAPFATGERHLGFRLASAFGLVMVWHLHGPAGDGELSLAGYLLVWVPFAAGCLVYALGRRARSEEVYVQSL